MFCFLHQCHSIIAGRKMHDDTWLVRGSVQYEFFGNVQLVCIRSWLPPHDPSVCVHWESPAEVLAEENPTRGSKCFFHIRITMRHGAKVPSFNY